MMSVLDLDKFNELLKGIEGKVFFLADENTHQKCLVPLVQSLPDLGEFETLEIPAGESSKSMEIAHQLWLAMLDLGVERGSLLVNVGGGVVTDLGGFLATLYKRGIPFVHVPTSLLSMVDAAHGGKNGVDLGDVKNAIGTFTLPKAVVIETDFLETLPKEEYRSGFAEMLKHGLIADEVHWKELLQEYPNLDMKTIQRSAEIKMEIVERDYKESGERKKLNFGHTLGHAIESQLLSEGRPVLHGEAVAVGMICASFLSHHKNGLSEAEFEEIVFKLLAIFPKIELPDPDKILSWLVHDKKNVNGEMRFVLLSRIGQAMVDKTITLQEALKSIQYYRGL